MYLEQAFKYYCVLVDHCFGILDRKTAGFFRNGMYVFRTHIEPNRTENTAY